MKVLILVFALLLLEPCASVIISRCDLAKEMLHRGVSRDNLNDWVCLAEAESSRDTQAINDKNRNGSWDYRIFHLNSKYWCQGQKTISNGCGLPCTSLLNNSLDPSAKCALKVYGVQGFRAWNGWLDKCQGKDISFYTKECAL